MADGISFISIALIGICFESLFFGMACLLIVTSTYLHIKRQQAQSGSHRLRNIAKPRINLKTILTPIFVGTTIVFLLAAGHWILDVYRLFLGFKIINGGKTPEVLYLNPVHSTHIGESALNLSTIVIGDAILIYRVFIVWNCKWRTVILPMLSCFGLAFCSIGSTYQFSRFKSGTDVFAPSEGRWVTSYLIFTICTNIYCTSMIVFRIWRINSSAGKLGGRSLMSVSAMIVESAAIYTGWSIMLLSFYESGSSLETFTVDNMPQISAIATLLINVRVGLGWATEPATSGSSTITVTFHEETVRRHDPLTPTNGFELGSPKGQWPLKESAVSV